MTSPADAPGSVRKLRLFAAVEVPEAVAARVLAAINGLRRRHAGGLRWTDPESWHLTVAFLGWVPEPLVGRVQAALAAAAAVSPPFTLSLTGDAGSFPSGVLWAGLRPQAALEGLAERVRERLVEVVDDLPDGDRPFRAHLTLARAKGQASVARQAAAGYRGPAASWPVERLVLMRSHPRVSGARYELMEVWPLAAPDA